MKRTDRNLQSKDKIIQAAIKEFGSKGYDNASLNAAISESDLSKGLVYHYFRNKDELYLACVKKIFLELTIFLKQTNYQELTDFEACLQEYFSRRLLFFKDNPAFRFIFLEVLVHPPEHLQAEISLSRKDYDAFNLHLVSYGIESMKLRANITSQVAIEYFLFFIDAFNYDFYNRNASNEELLELHTKKLWRMLDIILHGLLEA